MNDCVCDVLRYVIHDAVEEAFIAEDGELRDVYECESMNIEFTDIGLAIRFGDRLYCVSIERV